MQKKIVLGISLSIFSFCVVPALGTGLDSSKPLSEHSKENAWLHNYDPTLITGRLHSEFSYEDQENDQSLMRLETSVRWPFPINDHLTFGGQVMVPLAWKDTGTQNKSGVGNVEFRYGLAGRVSPTVRYGIAMNAEFPSANDDELGGTNAVFRTINAVRWDVMKGVNIGCNVEYSFTPLDNDAGKVSLLKLKFPLAFKISDSWSGGATYKPSWDFEEDKDRHRIKTSVTRNWGPDHRYAGSFSAELPLSQEAFNWKVVSGITCFF
jgi:hypothetical protein